MSAERTRQQLRVTVAGLLAQGVRREDLVADLVAAGRGLGTVGAREIADAVEITQLWADIEAYAPFDIDKGPPPSG